jgi:putative membrane protein
VTNRLEIALKSVVLAASGLMLWSKINSGALAFYINARFEWLVFAGAVLYLALALTLLFQLIQPRPTGAIPVTVIQGRARLSWVAVVMLALPAVIGYVAPARPLGASAIASRGIGLQSAPARPGNAVIAQKTGPKNILDWLRDISRSGDPTTLSGQQADVVGFVYRDDPRFNGAQFMVSRFTVSCCVADASAIGLIVETGDMAKLKQDQWVRVVGRFTVGEFGGEKIPVIKAEKIEDTTQPAQPYLFP